MGNLRQGQTISVVAQETLTSLCCAPHPALPHQSLFSPDRADQWPRVMVVSSFVRPYSKARHYDSSTRPEEDRGESKKNLPSHSCAKCTFGWACCCLGRRGEGGESPEHFFLMSMQRVKEGMWCLGLGNGLLGTDSSAPIELSKIAKAHSLLPHICQVHSSK